MNKKITYTVLIFITFYGVNILSHHILPKWWDIIIGFPLSLYLIYKLILNYIKNEY